MLKSFRKVNSTVVALSLLSTVEVCYHKTLVTESDINYREVEAVSNELKDINVSKTSAVQDEESFYN